MTTPINVQIGTPETIRTSIGTVQIQLADLNDLNDVDASSPTDGDVLMYNEETNTWVAGPLPEETVIDGGSF